MKKVFVSMAIGAAFCFIVWCATYVISEEIKKEVGSIESRYTPYVGKSIVLSKDTLKIVDYSLVSQSFTLSNGLKVSNKLVFNGKIY